MYYLILVSLIWAFSFGLIKGQLSGIDPYFVSFIRLIISFLFFVPFMGKGLKWKRSGPLLAIGALQFGIMYILYIYSYQFLAAWQIALFTIFTPLYVILFSDLWQRRIDGLYLVATFIAVLGGGLVVYDPLDSYELTLGFVLIQGANICFALGQVAYKEIRVYYAGISDQVLMPFLYLGAVIVTLAASLMKTDFGVLQINTSQIWVLVYLGAVASGLGFFLWNLGATRVNSGALAVLNNLKAPLAILVSVFIFNEAGNWFKALLAGLLIFSALILTSLKQKGIKDGVQYDKA